MRRDATISRREYLSAVGETFLSKLSDLPVDAVRPTANQISNNIIVVPKKFCDVHSEIDWSDFTLVAFGNETHHRRLDGDRRISVPLKGSLTPGDTLRLSVENGSLVIYR